MPVCLSVMLLLPFLCFADLTFTVKRFATYGCCHLCCHICSGEISHLKKQELKILVNTTGIKNGFTPSI